MAIFTTPVDVANRALQGIGVPRISNFTATKAGLETGFALDMLRQAELRRSVWNFATRRTVLRPIVSTTQNVSFLAYNAATTYAAGDVVTDSAGYLWLSLRAANLANTPGLGGVNPFWVAYFGPVVTQAWDTAVSYFPGDLVIVSTVVYICVFAHSAHTPPNATYWHVIAGATAAAIVQLSPLGVNPPVGASTRNLYRLPANYIRLAPQDPKAPGVERQGLNEGMKYNDWEVEGGYLFTADTAPIILRFVADETDVTLMDAMFCEAWAAQLGAEVAMTLTQSTEKLNLARGRYSAFIGLAKAINAIEEGSTDPELPEGGAPQQGSA